DALLSLRLLAVRLRADRQSDRPLPLYFLGDEPDHRDLLLRDAGDADRRRLRHLSPRLSFLRALRAARRAEARSGRARADRDHLLPVAADLAFGASLRQHARRA